MKGYDNGSNKVSPCNGSSEATSESSFYELNLEITNWKERVIGGSSYPTVYTCSRLDTLEISTVYS